jgi:hypothetical protein
LIILRINIAIIILIILRVIFIVNVI